MLIKEITDMDYAFEQDIKAVRTILGFSQEELASQLGTSRITIARNERGITEASAALLEQMYNYAFDKGIRLGKIKEMLCKENLKAGHKLLFHGAKSSLTGPIDVHAGRQNNDFGQGFYTGESYDQSLSFVSGFGYSSVYMLDLDKNDLTKNRYAVDQDWMLTIAYHRGTLENYHDHPIVKKLVEKSRSSDYIIAPIADNRMFQIINSFIDGEITDEQCKHCLAATNLGFQYVLLTEKAVNQVQILEHCYIPEKEKEHYLNLKTADARLGDDKVKLARRTYRGQGSYIDEILN